MNMTRGREKKTTEEEYTKQNRGRERKKRYTIAKGMAKENHKNV